MNTEGRDRGCITLHRATTQSPPGCHSSEARETYVAAHVRPYTGWSDPPFNDLSVPIGSRAISGLRSLKRRCPAAKLQCSGSVEELDPGIDFVALNVEHCRRGLFTLAHRFFLASLPILVNSFPLICHSAYGFYRYQAYEVPKMLRKYLGRALNMHAGS
ncbi:hypothetical protein BD309DRAFT_970518 [Dichomitus squalens]|uniref:Uncharacterized protein n=1 Tax=Dichomitus squalens TaxID=114155 RepID=A0A4Q9PJD9_9APHY|nr:hypothetical protein BD309DRAFT_970518 [Dichomitus squalens]TBU54209.1 hypothetical protein BD310DRAFT_99733 [Dichomitus squalens]